MKALYAIVLLLLLAPGQGCRRPKNCPGSEGTARCTQAGMPQWCDEGARWRSWATLPCGATGGVCAIREGVATCTRNPDAGLPNPDRD